MRVRHNLDSYYGAIACRSTARYYLGLAVRRKNNWKYALARGIARLRGATIGHGSILPLSLAWRANRNLTIGDHSSVQTNRLDLRSTVKIGSYVIIGQHVEIITMSHDLDDPAWSLKTYGIEIEDYAWLATNALLLPSCRRVGYGAVIGAGAVVVRNVPSMHIVSGNPAIKVRERSCVHSKLCVEALLGGDYELYRLARRQHD